MRKILAYGISASLLLSSFLEATSCCPTYCDYGCVDHFWVDAEYLYYQIQDSPAPIPLVNAGPTFGPILGAPGTTVVLGNEKIDNNWRSGGKFTLGYWFDDCCTWGIDGNYFFLGSRTNKKTVFSPGTSGEPVFGTPYINAITGVSSSNPISNSNPALDGGAYSGLAELKVMNKMQGAELNGIMMFPPMCNWKIGLLAGFRYWNFNENLSFDTNTLYLDISTSEFLTVDKFDVQNNFYGGQIGIGLEYIYDDFFFNLEGKVALGGNYGTTDIHGCTASNDFNTVVGVGTIEDYVGGIYALSTNIGNHSKTVFSVIPEVNFNIGYQISNQLRINVGYNFLYVSKMFWATQQVSNLINPTQSVAIADTAPVTLVGVAEPVALNKTDSLWIQGVNVGLEFRF